MNCPRARWRPEPRSWTSIRTPTGSGSPSPTGPGSAGSSQPRTWSDATARAAQSGSASARRMSVITLSGRTSGWSSGRPACGRMSGTARLSTTGSSIPTRPRWSARSIRRTPGGSSRSALITTPENARPGGLSMPRPGCQPARPCCPPIRGQRACRSPTGCARAGSSWPGTRLISTRHSAGTGSTPDWVTRWTSAGRSPPRWTAGRDPDCWTVMRSSAGRSRSG